jgi:hypothetical protein
MEGVKGGVIWEGNGEKGEGGGGRVGVSWEGREEEGGGEGWG